MMRHREDVSLSASRKSPGQTPFPSSPSCVWVPGASNERHSRQSVHRLPKPALRAGQPVHAPDTSSRHAPHHMSDRHHGAMLASRELVKNGMAGTGTSQEELPALGAERALEGYSVTIAAELGDGRHPGETVRERQRPVHSRKAGRRQAKKRAPAPPLEAGKAKQPLIGIRCRSSSPTSVPRAGTGRPSFGRLAYEKEHRTRPSAAGTRRTCSAGIWSAVPASSSHSDTVPPAVPNERYGRSGLRGPNRSL